VKIIDEEGDGKTESRDNGKDKKGYNNLRGGYKESERGMKRKRGKKKMIIKDIEKKTMRKVRRTEKERRETKKEN
jgi:hypothetical protein